jgi:methylmalonyl-CoA mutase cobalamin-binding subunit
MNTLQNDLRTRIQGLLGTWDESGLPPRTTLDETIEALSAWKAENSVPGLWSPAPRMLGATLDDGWGHGIQLILKIAAVMGVDTRFLGLLKTWEEIIASCEHFNPDFLGLTVLQFDTDESLIELRGHLPQRIPIIAGGPVFKYDPEFQERTGIDYVAGDAAEFMKLLLKILDSEVGPRI